MNAKTLKNVLSVILIVGLAMAAYKYLDAGLMIKAWRKFSWSSIGILLALPAVYLVLKAWRFLMLLRAVEDEIAGPPVLRGYVASQSASLLPGGFAARAAILSQADVPMERSVGPVLANSGLDQFVLLVAGLFLAFWYPAIRFPALALAAILVALIVALSVDRSRAWVVKMMDKAAGRFNKKDKMAEFHDACASMADPVLLAKTTVLTVVADVCSYAILCVVVGALGFKVEYWPLAAAYVIPTLLGRLSPLPAGAGVTEAGMVTFMAQQTGMNIAEAAAATTLMRVFDVVVPAIYGGIVYSFAWKGEEETVDPDAEANASPDSDSDPESDSDTNPERSVEPAVAR